MLARQLESHCSLARLACALAPRLPVSTTLTTATDTPAKASTVVCTPVAPDFDSVSFFVSSSVAARRTQHIAHCACLPTHSVQCCVLAALAGPGTAVTRAHSGGWSAPRPTKLEGAGRPQARISDCKPEAVNLTQQTALSCTATLTKVFELTAGSHPVVSLTTVSGALQVPTAVKVELVDRLSAAGLPSVEATRFVSPKWVPQLADAADVLRGITRRPGVRYPVLTQNVKARPYPVHCTLFPLQPLHVVTREACAGTYFGGVQRTDDQCTRSQYSLITWPNDGNWPAKTDQLLYEQELT